MKILAGLFLIGYILFPAADFIPDVTPFFGTLDDATAGALLVALMKSGRGSQKGEK